MGDTIKLAFSSMALPTKLAKGDPRWKDLTGSFVNMELGVADIANLVWSGHAFTVQLKKPWRDTSNYLFGGYACLDFDTGDKRSSLEELKKDPFIARYATMIYETYSADPLAGNYRSRVLFGFEEGGIHQAANYVKAASALLWLYSTGDPLCKDAARQWMGTYQKEIYLIDNRLPLDIMKDIIQRYEASGQLARKHFTPKPFSGQNDDETLDRLEKMMLGVVEGNRNATLNEVGYILGLNIADGRINESWGISIIGQAAQRVGLGDREIEYHLLRSVEAGKEAFMFNSKGKYH